MNNPIQFVEKALLPVARVVYRTPLMKRIYFTHFASYKFLRRKFEHKLHIFRPPAVEWLATYNCNFRCKHCEANAGNKHVQELTTNEVLRLMTELSEMKVERILISGGEALLRKDLFKIIRHILDNGMQYGIASNGYLVSRFKKEFNNMKPYKFFTSIDGLEQTNDEIRGKKGAFKKTFQAVEFFKSIGVNNRTINTVVFPGNIEELPELKERILESAATLWRFAFVTPVGRAKGNDNFYLNNKQRRYLLKFIGKIRREFNVRISEEVGYLGCWDLMSSPFFCGAGLTSCAIMPDGEVLGCQMAYDTQFSEGNVKQISFRKIWQNGFSRFRQPKYEKECLECKYMKPCRGGCWGLRLVDKRCITDVWR